MKKLPNIGEILSAPLVAAASANSNMISEQTRFMMETCFVSRDTDLYEPIMIEMAIAKNIAAETDDDSTEISVINSSFKIPLLTLVPLNSLVVKTVDIDFSLEVVSHTSNAKSLKESNEASHSENELLDNKSQKQKPVLTGKLSYDSNDKASYRSHNSSKLNVKIHADTIPLPLGVTTLIDIYVKSINTIPKANKDDI